MQIKTAIFVKSSGKWQECPELRFLNMLLLGEVM
jgi:hypothetical protein